MSKVFRRPTLAYKNEVAEMDNRRDDELPILSLFMRVLFCPVLVPCLFIYAIFYPEAKIDPNNERGDIDMEIGENSKRRRVLRIVQVDSDSEDENGSDDGGSVFTRGANEDNHSCFQTCFDEIIKLWTFRDRAKVERRKIEHETAILKAYENIHNKQNSVSGGRMAKSNIMDDLYNGFGMDICRTDRMILPFTGGYIEGLFYSIFELDAMGINTADLLRDDDDERSVDSTYSNNNNSNILGNKCFQLTPKSSLHLLSKENSIYTTVTSKQSESGNDDKSLKVIRTNSSFVKQNLDKDLENENTGLMDVLTEAASPEVSSKSTTLTKTRSFCREVSFFMNEKDKILELNEEEKTLVSPRKNTNEIDLNSNIVPSAMAKPSLSHASSFSMKEDDDNFIETSELESLISREEIFSARKSNGANELTYTATLTSPPVKPSFNRASSFFMKENEIKDLKFEEENIVETFYESDSTKNEKPFSTEVVVIKPQTDNSVEDISIKETLVDHNRNQVSGFFFKPLLNNVTHEEHEHENEEELKSHRNETIEIISLDGDKLTSDVDGYNNILINKTSISKGEEVIPKTYEDEKSLTSSLKMRKVSPREENPGIGNFPQPTTIPTKVLPPLDLSLKLAQMMATNEATLSNFSSPVKGNYFHGFGGGNGNGNANILVLEKSTPKKKITPQRKVKSLPSPWDYSTYQPFDGSHNDESKSAYRSLLSIDASHRPSPSGKSLQIENSLYDEHDNNDIIARDNEVVTFTSPTLSASKASIHTRSHHDIIEGPRLSFVYQVVDLDNTSSIDVPRKSCAFDDNISLITSGFECSDE